MTGATVIDRPTTTAELDHAHGRLVGALSLLNAAGRDDPDCDHGALDRVHGAVDGLTSLLVARAREDLAAAVLPGQSYEARISGSPAVSVDPDDPHAGTVSLTAADRAADRLHPVSYRIAGPDGPVDVYRLEGHAVDSPTYARVQRRLASVADHLQGAARRRPDADGALAAMTEAGKRLADLYADVTPTGETCRTVAHDDQGRRVQCERVATHRGHCTKCWPQIRDGFPPDAALLRDWNSQLDRDCRCTSTVCAAGGAHMPGGCLTRIGAGEPKRTCDTCTKRKWRARRDEKAADGPLEPDPTEHDTGTGRSTTGTGGAFSWRNRKGTE